MLYSMETGEGERGRGTGELDPTTVESPWPSLLYSCIPMEEQTCLGSKLSRKFSGRPSRSTPDLVGPQC